MIFEICLWVCGILPGVIFQIMKIKAKNYFQQLQQKIQAEASNIDNYLGFNHKIESGVVVPEPRIENKTPCGRVTMMERNTTERKKDFNIVENGMTCKEANQEAHRCLRCDRFGYGVFKGGRVEEW